MKGILKLVVAGAFVSLPAYGGDLSVAVDQDVYAWSWTNTKVTPDSGDSTTSKDVTGTTMPNSLAVEGIFRGIHLTVFPTQPTMPFMVGYDVLKELTAGIILGYEQKTNKEDTDSRRGTYGLYGRYTLEMGKCALESTLALMWANSNSSAMKTVDKAVVSVTSSDKVSTYWLDVKYAAPLAGALYYTAAIGYKMITTTIPDGGNKTVDQTMYLKPVGLRYAF